MNTTYINRKENRPAYVRTVHADQTAYTKDNYLGFKLFVMGLIASIIVLVVFFVNYL